METAFLEHVFYDFVLFYHKNVMTVLAMLGPGSQPGKENERKYNSI